MSRMGLGSRHGVSDGQGKMVLDRVSNGGDEYLI